MARLSTFTDFHLGQEHGWVSVTRMTGRGPVLLMLPENGAAHDGGPCFGRRAGSLGSICAWLKSALHELRKWESG
jgi:hypothetical protein